jgi:hypothetical protein
MVLGRFAHLKPLPKPLVSRTLTLRVDHFPDELTLQLKRTPRQVSGDMRGLESQQEQVSHDGDSHRAFHALDLVGDLMWPESHDTFEFLHQQFHLPPAEIDGHNLACGYRFWQIGHEALGLLRPLVAPTCAEHDRDVSEMAQPHPFGIDPERAPTLTIDGRNADACIPPAGQVGDQRFERFAMGELPRAG